SLFVAVVHTECVKLHQLACVVLIEAALLTLLLRRRSLTIPHLSDALIDLRAGRSGILPDTGPHPRRQLATVANLSLQLRLAVGVAAASRLWRVGRDILKIVEIEEHRRTLRGADKQVLEIAQRIGPDHVALVARNIPTHRVLTRENVEMVLPEIDHHFLQLS